MKRGKESFGWFPLWSDNWLWGSTRHELDHAQRAIFIDLMAIANKDDGHIRANPTTPYPLRQLAGMLCCDEALIESTIKICIEKDKLKDLGNGFLFISNWDEYQLSARHKRRMADNSDSVSVNADAMSAKADPSYLLYSSLIFSYSSNSWEGIKPEDKESWAKAFPACDIDAELNKMAEWIKANPKQGKKSNYRRFITNWLSRQQDRGGTNRGAYAKKDSLPDKSKNIGARSASFVERLTEAGKKLIPQIDKEYDALIDSDPKFMASRDAYRSARLDELMGGKK